MSSPPPPSAAAPRHLPPAGDLNPPGFHQHRCHPRLADVVHTVMTLQPSLFPERARLLFACYRSEPGQEPTDNYILDPREQAVRLHTWSKAAAAPPPPQPDASTAPTRNGQA
jgi:hypothetical protein